MAAQRRSLLQSVRTPLALRAGGWEPRGNCRVQARPPLRLWAASQSLAGCGRHPSRFPGRPTPPLIRDRGARAAPQGLRVRAAAQAVGGSDSRSSGRERQGRVEGASVLNPAGTLARGRRESPSGEPTPAPGRSVGNPHSNTSPLCMAYCIPGFVPVALHLFVSLIFISAP